MQDIYLRNVPPPLETFNHTAFLKFFASWVRPERYLELGTRDGRTFTEIAPHCKQAVAVDCVPLPFDLPKNAVYEQMYTDEYFKKIQDSNVLFDMVFIDADHSFEQSFKDFLNVKDKVIFDGFVFFHDTYPYSEFMTAPDLSNECYKTPVEIKKQFSNEWEVLTLPFNPGVTVAKKLGNKILPWMP